MTTTLFIILGLLCLLAVIDLFVGVSNDAVNFLNAAVGSRAAPFALIVTVAGLGVLSGATFSSGMMEVAKTAVLVPEHLTFSEVIVIFTAVIVSNILLLNTFNSLGLPTSTTVSIVFELLGGTVAVAALKIWANDAPVTDLGLYLNAGKALAMIMAILFSVVIAFVAGSLVQTLVRLIFTFDYQRLYRRLGALTSALSVTVIFYFLIIKGAQGSVFMTPERAALLEANALRILIGVFVAAALIFQLLVSLTTVNVFRGVILIGTFALAFAFASNDLVNFVGVPLAALESARLFLAAGGADPEGFTMEGLRSSGGVPGILLFLSGLVMVLTIAFSRKAHDVIRTSVNLASSANGSKEQFGSSLPARLTVRYAMRANEAVRSALPKGFFRILEKRFKKERVEGHRDMRPFDELRAIVNLVIAAFLISAATALQLPLSTTYVTFMVAMGSSLADGAWDRESAVYRISGVFTVISGWFLTAFSAFTLSALIAWLFSLFGTESMIAMMVLALLVVIKSNVHWESRKSRSEGDEEALMNGDPDAVTNLLSSSVTGNRRATLALFVAGLEAFLREDAESLRRVKGDAALLYDTVTNRRGMYYRLALEKNGNPVTADARNFYYRAFTGMKAVSYSLIDQLDAAQNYVDNCHSPFTGRMHDSIWALSDRCLHLRQEFDHEHCRETLFFIENEQKAFMAHIADEQLSLRKSELYLGFLLFAKDVLNHYRTIDLLQIEMETRVPRSA